MSADAYSVAAMGMPAPDAVKRLVDRFDQNRKVFLSGEYLEERLPKTKTPHGGARGADRIPPAHLTRTSDSPGIPRWVRAPHRIDGGGIE